MSGDAPLWAPWRMEYILGERPDGCIFCGVDGAGSSALDERLVVWSGNSTFVMLNRFPFAAAHLLVVPHVHKADLESLSAQESRVLFSVVRESASRLKRAVHPEGLNVGMNLGRVAGAGVAEHIHVHIVPRWSGDTNFMPVIAGSRVMPQALRDTLKHLRDFFSDLREEEP